MGWRETKMKPKLRDQVVTVHLNRERLEELQPRIVMQRGRSYLCREREIDNTWSIRIRHVLVNRFSNSGAYVNLSDIGDQWGNWRAIMDVLVLEEICLNETENQDEGRNSAQPNDQGST